MGYPIGRTGFNLGAVMVRPKRLVRAELYIAGDQAKMFQSLLKQQAEAIETELGYPLTWEELPDRRDARVSVYLFDADPDDPQDWERQHGWMADRLNDLHRVFSQRVRLLTLDGEE